MMMQADTIGLHKTDARSEDAIHDLTTAFTAQLNRIDAKLDRLIERQK